MKTLMYCGPFEQIEIEIDGRRIPVKRGETVDLSDEVANELLQRNGQFTEAE